MTWKRLLYALFAVTILCVMGSVLLYFYLKPSNQERTEIFRGVFLTVETLPQESTNDGRVMIVEVHWDTPGLRIENRPYDYPIDLDQNTGAHYKLELADVALRRTDAAILMNTSLYFPAGFPDSFPGNPVRSNETLVVDREVSHVHDHSYLLYWDEGMSAHMQQTKPPSEASLDAAIMGIGMQGIQINHGIGRFNTLSNKDVTHDRTFIGVNPEKRILYLMAFENASGYAMIEKGVATGLTYGGQLDSGNSTHLLVGEGAKGVNAHAGIRNIRPLGPYLMIYADRLQ